MAEEYTRSEFLKSLLNQKKAIINNDSNLVNPSVSNADGSLANQDSAEVSVGSTDIQNETGESEQYKESRNGWQRFWDSVANFTHNINEGIQKYIFDPIGDAGIWLLGEVGSWFGADTQWAENAINYDWGAHYLNVMDQLDFGSNIMSGDFFGADGGDYWKNWADTGSVEASRQNFANLKAGSLMSDASPEVQQGFETGEQILGALLPSIILAIATAGSSAGVQAAAFGTQVAVAGVSGFGKGVEESLGEGGDYHKAGAYGLARGATDAALTYAGGKIAGQLLGGGAGTKAASAVFGKTGSQTLATITKIATNAGIAGVTAAVDEAVVRPAEKLIYDQEAWKKAYGDKSATYQTLTRARQAGLTAMAMSAVSQTVVEGGKRVSLGKEGYNNNFLAEMDNASGKMGKLQKNVKEMQSLSDQMSKAYNKLESGAWTEEQYNAYVSTRLNKFEQVRANSEALFDKYAGRAISPKVEAKYGDQIRSIRYENANMLASKLSGSMTRARATQFIKMATDNGYTIQDIKGRTYNFISSSGNSVVTLGTNKNDSPMITYVMSKTGKPINFPIDIKHNGEIRLLPNNSTKITNALTLVSKNSGSEFSKDIVIRPDMLVDKNTSLPNKINELSISPEVAKEITSTNSTEQLKEFFSLVKENKGKQVIKDGDRYLIINTFEDANGVSQTAITTVDSKFASIQSLKIKETGSIIPNQVGNSRAIAEAVNNAVFSENFYGNEPKYIKAYGDLNHERVLSMKKSQDIIDICKEQVLDKVAKADNKEFKIQMKKGELSRGLFEAVNTLEDKYNEKGYMVKSDLSDAIEQIAQDISESKLITIYKDTGVQIESSAGHKEDLIKAITGLVKAKSELSKIAKLEKRYDIAIEKKNQQIQAIRERANKHLETAVKTFREITADLRKQVNDLKKTKDLAVQITRNREKFRGQVTGDYDYNQTEERDLHTVNLLAKPLDSLTRNKGRYSISAESFNEWKKAQEIYIRENYELEGSVDFNEEVRLTLTEAIESLAQDVGKPELSLDSYQAVKNYQDALVKYERELSRIEHEERKPSAYTASAEIDAYNINLVQKIFDPITKNFGGKAGEIFKLYGFGEISKKTVIAMDQASGEKINFVATMTEKLANCMPKGFHHREVAGTINGVKITKGQLLSLYISTELAPVNAENMDIGGVGFRNKKGIDWAFEGSGHLEEIKTEVNKLISVEEKEIAKNLFNLLNGEMQESYIKWQKEIKHQVDVPKVENYFMMFKEKQFLTSVDKMVKGEPAFRYAEKRTNDKRGLVIADVVDIFTSYIDGLGTQMYLTPKVHEAYALLNTKDQNGVPIHRKIAEKYGEKSVKYLIDLVDGWIKKTDTQSTNIVTKFMNFLTEGYTVSKLADLIRPVKNFFSFITSNTGLGKQTKGYISRFSKETRDDVNWLIENHIYNLKYREYDNALLKGNAPTTYQGIKGKVDKVLMFPVYKVDKAAMIMGLTSIVSDVKAHNFNVRDPEVIKYIKDAYSIFNLCNVNGDPNHQNLLNEHTLTKYLFNILAGAKRAQVASMAIQSSLWQQNHHITKEAKAKMDSDLTQAHVSVEEKTKALERVEAEYEKALDLLATRRDFRDYVVNSKQDISLVAEARKEVADQKAVVNDLKDKVNKAREEKAKAFANEKTEQNKQESYKHYEYAGGRKIPAEMLAKTLISGVLVTLVGMLANWLYGKKNLTQYTKEEMIAQLATNSFLNWVPVVDSVGNKILKGYDIDSPSISTLNNFMENVSNIYDSIKEGNLKKGTILGLIATLEGITGLPLDTARKYVTGILKLFNPEAAIKWGSLFYNTSANYAAQNYNDAVASGDDRTAKAYLNYMSDNFKGGVSDDFINSEILDLSKQGYNALPRNVMSSYVDEEGNTVKLSSAQITQFTQLYAQSKDEVREMIKTAEYKSATAEEKAKLIKNAYDYYYSYAKAKILGTSGDSKISKMLVLTNGNMDLAKYLIYLQKIGTIKENKQKTRKELVLDYINRLKGLSKGEKIMLMYLSGFSVSGDSQNVLVKYLVQQGGDRADILKVLKGNND